MALTKREIKKRLGRGGQKRVADAVAVSPSLVSAVMNRKTQMYAKDTVLRVRTEIASQIGETVEQAFGTAA